MKVPSAVIILPQPPWMALGTVLAMSRHWELVALAVAVVCLIADVAVRHVRRLRGYEAGDTTCSVVLGLGGFAAWTIARAAVLAIGVVISQYLPVCALIPDGITGWVLTLLGVDFGYYLYHRVLHRTNAGWAIHAVHHSSSCFNYATALRGSLAEPFIEPWFHVWLLLLGADPIEVVAAMSVNHVYQFCLHTEAVGQLKWVERLFVTPSHHRVHHACNGEYLDRNFGAMLVIWDHLFGTYAQETHPPVYGLVKPIQSHSPLTVLFQPLAMLVQELRAQPTIRAGLLYLVSRPDASVSSMESPLS